MRGFKRKPCPMSSLRRCAATTPTCHQSRHRRHRNHEQRREGLAAPAAAEDLQINWSASEQLGGSPSVRK